MQILEYYLHVIHSILLQPAVTYVFLFTGIFFTIALRFVQFRYVKEILINSVSNGQKNFGFSQMQSLAVSLSVRVGTGNMASTAGAIMIGGPGVSFWMFIVAIFGIATSFVESVMGQIYKVKFRNQYVAGTALFAYSMFADMTGYKKLAGVLALTMCAIFVSIQIVGLVSAQTNASAYVIKEAFGIYTWISGLIFAILIGLVILGGFQRIAAAAEMLVPIMGIGYIFIALIIIIANIDSLPWAIKTIVQSAFTPHAVLGGMFGITFMKGIQRGVYSNEAGMATVGPHIGGTTQTNHPAKPGLVQGFAVFIDTVIICSISAILIVITKKYNMYIDPMFYEQLLTYIKSGAHESGVFEGKALHSDVVTTLQKILEANPGLIETLSTTPVNHLIQTDSVTFPPIMENIDIKSSGNPALCIQYAFDTIFSFNMFGNEIRLGAMFVAIVATLFSFTTMLINVYTAHLNFLIFLYILSSRFGIDCKAKHHLAGKKYCTAEVMFFLFALLVTFLSSISTPDAVWTFMDIGVMIFIYVNLPLMYIGLPAVMRVFNHYVEENKKKGGNQEEICLEVEEAKKIIPQSTFWANGKGYKDSL